jgi:hypothetical protein
LQKILTITFGGNYCVSASKTQNKYKNEYVTFTKTSDTSVTIMR